MPTFVVVGAARSGSTALCTFLGQHPELFVTSHKEPSFYVFDGTAPAFTGPGDEGLNRMIISDRRQYEALFDDADPSLGVGEGSVFYLHCPESLPRIHRDLPEVKTIAILRDPIERAFSAFSLMVREGREPETDFMVALDKEADRRRAGWEHIWEYSGGSLYADRVERLLAEFGPEQVLLLRYDDFASDQAAVLARTFAYLGVDPAFELGATPRVNASGRAKSRRVQQFLTEPRALKDKIRPLVPERLWQGLYRFVQNKNLGELELPDEARARLAPLFAEDTDRLETITGWDLADWRASGLPA